jgi:hypothetical protein
MSTWCEQLKQAMTDQTPDNVVVSYWWAKKLKCNVTTVRNWWYGTKPGPEWHPILKQHFPDIDIPMRSNRTRAMQAQTLKQNFDEHLARLSAEQDAHYLATGQRRVYALEDIAGPALSKERVRQIEQIAAEKLLQGLALRCPDVFRDAGATEEEILHWQTCQIVSHGGCPKPKASPVRELQAV